jgi:hypothetical protein
MKIGLEEARALDAADPLARFRDEFEFPPATPLYFAGHSLGLLPKRARVYVDEEMEVWSREAVEGHFAGERPWMPYHELVAPSLARIAGAREGEVVAMNSVTVNLHLLLVSFYRPKPLRHRILLEEGAFPSRLRGGSRRRPRRGKPCPRPARRRPRLRGLVLVQVLERRSRSAGRRFRPRAARGEKRSSPLRRLVGT